ncbi:MAG: hypothetical protein ACE5JJ_07020 [Nitrospinota bacterium]
MDARGVRDKQGRMEGWGPRAAGALTALVLLAAPPLTGAADPAQDGARASPRLKEAYELAEGGSFERAAALLDRIVLLRPLDSEAHLLRAFIYRVLLGHFERKAYREAFEESAQTALRLLKGGAANPLPAGERELRLGFIQGMLALRRFEEGLYLQFLGKGRIAWERFQRALALDPCLADAYLGLGLYHFWRSRAPVVGWVMSLWGDTAEQGLRELKRAAEGGGRLQSLARLELASALFWEKRFEEGRRALAPLLRARPRHILYRFALAESYYRAKDWKQSLRRFQALARELEGRGRSELERLYATFARWRVVRSLYRLGRKGEAARLAAELARVPDLDSKLLKEIRARAAELAQEAGLLDAPQPAAEAD